MGDRMSRSEIECIVSEIGTYHIADDGESICCVMSDNQMLDI